MSTTHVDGAAPQPVAAAHSPAESTGLSITALVLGILSIVAGWTFLVPVVGLILGLVALNREPRGRTIAIWGVVLNAVMLAGSLIVGLVAGAIGLALLPFHLFW